MRLTGTGEMKFFIASVRRPHIWGVAALTCASVLFVTFQAPIAPNLGYWTDEVYSLWASDPMLDFGEAFRRRILPDTNPPLYFSMLWFVRQIAPDGRTAFLMLNAVGMLSLIGLTLVIARRARAPAVGLWIVGLFLVSAPALIYAPEGRAYGWALCTTLALGTLAGTVVAGEPARRWELATGAALAVLAAWLHLFGGVFAGSLGAALVISGLFVARRPDIVRLGLMIGGAASIATAVWLAFAYRMVVTTATDGFWIVLDRAQVISIIWVIEKYAAGSTTSLVAGGLLVAAGFTRRALRPLSTTIVLCSMIFGALPFLASLHTPIVEGRYFLVGCPGAIAMAVILWRGAVLQARTDRRLSLPGVAALAGAFFLATPILTGAADAAEHFKARWEWRGAEAVESALPDCVGEGIRTLNSAMPETARFHYGFGFDIFLKGRLPYANAAAADLRDVSDIRCPVLGWAEHYTPGGDGKWWRNATPQEVLTAFRLTNRANLALAVDRHNGGLILRRADWRP